MPFSLSIFLYLFLFAVLLFLIFSFFNVYHVFRFGFLTPVTIATLVLYLFVSAGMLIAAAIYIMGVDWSAPLFSS